MKARERLDQIIANCRDKIQEEVSALLGKKFLLEKPETSVLSKEDYFARPGGKTVLAHLQLEGDLEGQGALLLPLKGAIRIGGTLIMLPDSELDSAVADEEYSDELEDSYGEIANIIAGALTSTFEEQYPKSFRFVRTEQEVILPVKVDPDSDEPVPPGTYYLMEAGVSLEEQDAGSLHLLLPAAAFGLVEESGAGGADEVAPAGQQRPADGGEGGDPGRPGVLENEPAATATPAASPIPGEPRDRTGSGNQQAAAPARQDVGKQKKLVDRILRACHDRVGVEVGGLVGAEFQLTPEKNRIITKEDFLDQAGGRQILARMDVRGDGEGEVFLFTPIKDAIFLGGSLIMLPEAELEETVRNEEFGADAEDAFGEIANIIAGAYTAVFEEQYRKNLGFVKTGLEQVVPVKIDPDSDDTLPNQLYYLSSATMRFNDRDLGRLQILFPAALLDLEGLDAPGENEVVPAGNEPVQAGSGGSGQQGGSGSPGELARETVQTPDILIITDTDAEAANIAAVLEGRGYHARILHFKDPLHNHLTTSIRLVFLVMAEVSEQGFGVAIKISASGIPVPLVAAGPAWTRTLVLKAVRYGADDILITPASAEDIQEKLDANLTRKAA